MNYLKKVGLVFTCIMTIVACDNDLNEQINDAKPNTALNGIPSYKNKQAMYDYARLSMKKN